MDTAFVYWLQDLLGVGTSRQLSARLGRFGALVGSKLEALEATLLRRSDHVVTITDDFLPVLNDAGVDAGRVTAIENWAPIDEIPTAPKRNKWSERYDLADRFTFLYAGTIGLKHDPQMLVDLADAVGTQAWVVVVSEGPGADWISERARERSLENLAVLDYQPYEHLAEMLSAGDVLIALLEPDAGVFSVPSKVLTYHCAQRPLLCAIPGENLAARIIERNETGIVVDPGSTGAFVSAAHRLIESPELRARLGENARSYAESTFNIERITDRFESVIREAISRRRASVPR